MGHKLRDRIKDLSEKFEARFSDLEAETDSLRAERAGLKAELAQPAIHQTFNYHGDVNIETRNHRLRDAIDAATVQGLRETINRLTQHPLRDGHSYAELPRGTNIVTMADGTMRLALPVELSFTASTGVPEACFALTVEPRGDET